MSVVLTISVIVDCLHKHIHANFVEVNVCASVYSEVEQNM